MIIYGTDTEYGREVVGGKGYGLFRLLRYGFRVPDFFVIAAGTDLGSEAFRKDLQLHADKLGCNLFSVRSSGVSEDGGEASFAGQFLTELNIPREGLLSAVQRVCASANGESATAYSRRLGALPPDMAIVVQRQIAGRESGVLFSSSPSEPDTVLIERVSGAGERLVGGKTVPQTLRFAKDARGSGYEHELIQAAARLEKEEGSPVDVEWTYDGMLWLLQLRRQTALSDRIPPVAERDWNLYVYRDFSVFCHSVQVRASLSEVQRELFGFSVPIEEGLLVCGREFYSERNETATNAVWAELDRGDFFENFLKQIEAVVRSTKRRAAAIQKRDFSVLSDEALFAAYDREMNAYLQSYVPMLMRPDDYLFARLVALAGRERAEEMVGAVKAVLPSTYYSREHTRFLRAVASGDSASYLDEYEWKNNPLGKRFSPVTYAEFAARAEGISRERAAALLRKSANEKRKDRAHARSALTEAGEEKRVLDLIAKFTYYRTRTAENSDRYFYYIRKGLLAEIARRCGIDDETLMLYREHEIPALRFGKRLARTEIVKRKSGEAIVFQSGGYRTYFGANAYALLNRLLPDGAGEGAVHGEIACTGEVTARVKVVSGFAEAAEMERGCILVASMTTPDLTLALERAAGIITDEGGITCHAAIVAREYAVPCLVGTRCATRTLRDGMTVELNCVKGYFRIIKD